jgi:hypothetical protein
MRTAIALCCLFACSSDEGVAPEISNLTFTPTTITVGTQSTVTGSIQFTDADSDQSQIGIEVELPDQTRQSIPKTDLQGVDGQSEGTIAWAVLINPPFAGTYRFFLFITDAEDHESNRLEGMLDAQ